MLIPSTAQVGYAIAWPLGGPTSHDEIGSDAANDKCWRHNWQVTLSTVSHEQEVRRQIFVLI